MGWSARSDFPVFDAKIRHAMKLAGVVRNKDHIPGQSLPGDQDIIWSDRRTRGREMRTQFTSLTGVFAIELQNFELQSLDPRKILGGALPFVRPVKQLVRDDGMDREILRRVLPNP